MKYCCQSYISIAGIDDSFLETAVQDTADAITLISGSITDLRNLVDNTSGTDLHYNIFDMLFDGDSAEGNEGKISKN